MAKPILCIAPAYAYKPLELYKGLGNDGAIITFPAVNMTMDLIIRPENFPVTLVKIREHGFGIV